MVTPVNLAEIQALIDEFGEEEAGRILTERVRALNALVPPGDVVTAQDGIMRNFGDEPDLVRLRPQHCADSGEGPCGDAVDGLWIRGS